MGGRYDRKIDSDHFNQNSSHEKLLMQIKPGSKVLECGCATGYMTRYMRDELRCHVSIVEYDAEAYNVARQYADDGICADLMQEEWLDKFQGEHFDYILFADVLEHLYDPSSVLKSAVSLLKKDGRVLVSLPNVAHGDILLNLWRGNWNYTETGLLDRTHIRFFAENDLDDFFQKAGLSIIRLDYTTHPVGQTEQVYGIQGVVDSDLSFFDLVNKKENISVYQFIVTAQFTEYVQEHHIKKEQVTPKNEKIATLYYSRGEGFSEEYTKKVYYSTSNFHNRFEWKRDFPKELRFDPVEGQACIVSAIRVLSNEGELEVTPANGRRTKNMDYFIMDDPQYQIKVENLCINWIEIHAQIELFPNGQIQAGIAQLLQDCVKLEEIQKIQESSVNELHGIIQKCEEEKENLILQFEGEKQILARKYGEETQLLIEQHKKNENKLVQKCEEIKQQLAHYQEHYHAAIAQREELKVQLSRAQNAYNAVSNAFFWKITKPARVMTDALKALLKKNRYTYLFFKGLKCLKQNGLSYTWKKAQEKLFNRQDYSNILNPFTAVELEQQKKTIFPKKIKFSILVPLYNTPEQFLKEMIQSVLDQTYGNWELCLADGSDDKHKEVEKICRQYARKDNRICYKKLEKNLGISENSNKCIEMASGDYFVLLDHDDLLHPSALYEVMKVISEQEADFIYTDEGVFHSRVSDCIDFHLKSDYAPDTLRSVNYICHLSAFQADLLKKTGGFRRECDGSQDYDLILRITEKAKKIVHIPLVLYYWRSHQGSTASSIDTKPYTVDAGHRALQDHLQRMGLEGEAFDTVLPTMYRIRYKIFGTPKVSIIIPNQDHVEDLRNCLESIYALSTYSNYEIIIVENGSSGKEIFNYYKEIEGKWENVQVVLWKNGFNYAAINNFGVKYAQGEYIILLNNDTKVISPGWIEEMLMFCQRGDVGAAGAKLYYPDNTIQHAGIIVGIGSTAGHQHKGANRNDYGFLGRLICAQNLSAVTGACMMIRKNVWDEVGGLDEDFAVAFNDVDICLRIRKAGYLIVWTPFAELYHFESKSRGYEDTPEKQERFQREVCLMQKRWADILKRGDPYYNPNLTLDREDFSIKCGAIKKTF